jgi:hypothetical protein
MAVSVSDVESWSSTGWTQLDGGTRKQDLLDKAKSIVDGQLSTRQSNFSTLEGDRDEAVELLAAHFYEIAEGGESQSENSQGGSVSYNTVTGEWQNSLTETRYGRILSDMYLRDRQGLGLVRTY